MGRLTEQYRRDHGRYHSSELHQRAKLESSQARLWTELIKLITPHVLPPPGGTIIALPSLALPIQLRVTRSHLHCRLCMCQRGKDKAFLVLSRVERNRRPFNCSHSVHPVSRNDHHISRFHRNFVRLVSFAQVFDNCVKVNRILELSFARVPNRVDLCVVSI